MKVAIYARVSTLDQKPEMQLAELRQYAARRGLVIHAEYVDQVTGNVRRRQVAKTRRDKSYTALLADAKRKLFDVVLVWKYDRFARSLTALVDALETFAAVGIEFISLTEQVDTTTPQGKLFFTFIAGFAEYERAMISERVLAGLAHAKSQGTTLGRPRDISVEREVLQLHHKGQSLAAIASKVKRSRAGVRKIIHQRGQA
jgi:DNA invertase Pin-like site-specific DNA recombinase